MLVFSIGVRVLWKRGTIVLTGHIRSFDNWRVPYCKALKGARNSPQSIDDDILRNPIKNTTSGYRWYHHHHKHSFPTCYPVVFLITLQVRVWVLFGRATLGQPSSPCNPCPTTTDTKACSVKEGSVMKMCRKPGLHGPRDLSLKPVPSQHFWIHHLGELFSFSSP